MRDVTQPARARGTMLSAVAVVAALSASLAFAPLASATSDPLASGTTILTVKKGFTKKLKNKKIKLLKWGSGKVKNRNVTLAVTGGSLDPLTGEGTTEQGGGFKFRYRKRTVPIVELTIDRTGKAAYAKVANARMKLGFLGKYSFTRNGFGVDVNAGKLKLTGKAARRINNKLGMKKQKPFKGGDVMSNAYSTTQPKTVAVLPSGEATLVTDPITVVKFLGLGVELTPIPPASEKLALPPLFFFPIGGGTIAPNATGGIVQTTGGVKLRQEPFPTIVTTMTLNEIFVDLDAKTATVEAIIETNAPGVTSPGNIGRSSIADLNLTGATITSDPNTHTVSVANATATLQEVTAGVLNTTFAPEEPPGSKKHVEVFKAGDSLGTFSFVAQTQ